MPLLSPSQDRPELPADAQVGILAGAPADLLEMYAYWQRKHADVAKRLSDAEDAWLKVQTTLDQARA